VTDRIELTGIRGFGFHGVFDEERKTGQDFVVDLSIACDLHEAGLNDDLEATLNYGVLAISVQQILEGSPVNLIETLAERIAVEILKHERVISVRVTVHKPSAPIAVPFDDVAVVITRGRE